MSKYDTIVVVDEQNKRLASWISSESYKDCQEGDILHEINPHANHLYTNKRKEIVLRIKTLHRRARTIYAVVAREEATKNEQLNWQDIIAKT